MLSHQFYDLSGTGPTGGEAESINPGFSWNDNLTPQGDDEESINFHGKLD